MKEDRTFTVHFPTGMGHDENLTPEKASRLREVMEFYQVRSTSHA